MYETVKEKQLELREKHLKNGVIDVRKLKQGTRIELVTADEVFELEVGTPERCVVLLASNKRFEQRVKAVVLGGFDPDTRIFLSKLIGQGLRIALLQDYKPSIKTGPVLAAKVRGKDDSYEYQLWGASCQPSV